MIKDGTNFQPRQFEKDTINPRNMQNFALRELTEKRGSPKQRAKRSLRILLPAWLSRKATQDAEQMDEEMK